MKPHIKLIGRDYLNRRIYMCFSKNDLSIYGTGINLYIAWYIWRHSH